jgi:hypothetical protein
MRLEIFLKNGWWGLLGAEVFVEIIVVSRRPLL